VGEQHVREDLGLISSLADWVNEIRPEASMGRAQKLDALAVTNPAALSAALETEA